MEKSRLTRMSFTEGSRGYVMKKIIELNMHGIENSLMLDPLGRNVRRPLFQLLERPISSRMCMTQISNMQSKVCSTKVDNLIFPQASGKMCSQTDILNLALLLKTDTHKPCDMRTPLISGMESNLPPVALLLENPEL